MIKSALDKKIVELLSVESNWWFKVPRYQREYTWGKENWNQLFDDIWENDPGYFLGSMICINSSDDSTDIQDLELVDGQQRMTTISILYAAIYSILNKCISDDEDSRDELNDIRRRLIFKKHKDRIKVVPSTQGHNLEDYQAVLRVAKILDGDEKPKFAGIRRVFRAYRFFIDRLDELDEKKDRVFDEQKIQAFLEKLNKASLVKIEVGSNSDAFTLFESLNNRGIPLSALDLIKNKLLGNLEKASPDSIDENFKKWTKLLECLSDHYAVQERFIRQYYNAFKHTREIAVPKASLATRSNIIRIYEHLIRKDAKWIFDDLHQKAKLYSQLINPMNDGVPIDLANQLQNLDRIGGAPAYVLLLYLLAERPEANISGICEFLVCFFVRRNLTDMPPTRDLARIFIDIIVKVSENAGREPYEVVLEQMATSTRIASDDQFKAKLSGSIYLENADATRFVLCSIEEHQQTNETKTELWKRDAKGNFIWTIEHIFPQGQNIPDSWVEMIAGGDAEKAKELLETHTHKLGNLTISGYNPTLGNKSFKEKRDRPDKRGNFVGYKNGLVLNSDLKQAEEWTVSDIDSRTVKLVEIAMRLFSLNLQHDDHQKKQVSDCR